MGAIDTAVVRAALEKRLEGLLVTRARMHRAGAGAAEAELSHVDNHPADAGTETHEQELDATTDVFFDEEERRIQEALHALDAGTYGACAGCAQPIQAERLLAMPEAVLCVECQRGFEGWHRQRAIRV